MRRAYAVLCLALGGCDPTAGLSDTAGAALPDTKRYFDGPGSQLAPGPWNRVVVDLDLDTLYHVGARRTDDDEPTFHLFGNDARQGCAVTPNAGTWLMGKSRTAPYRLLPFLESIDSRGRGRLRFTELDCNVQDLVIEDAGRPYPRLYDHGYLVPTKRGYTFADPWRGETQEVTADLHSVLVWDDPVLLWGDGQLKSFSGQFEPGTTWGNQLQVVLRVNDDDYLVEDADGLHRVKFDRDTLQLSAETVLKDACRLQHGAAAGGGSKGPWLALQMPCGAAKPTLIHFDLETSEPADSIELPLEIDSRDVRPFMFSEKDDGAELLSVIYATDLDAGGLGTVWSYELGAEAPLELGKHADPDSAARQRSDSDWDGTLEANVVTVGGTSAYDLVRFRLDGTTNVRAERVVRNGATGELLVNFDGVAGDLPLFDNDGYRVLAHGVPAFSGDAASIIGKHQQARVDRFDGNSGRLLLGNSVDLGSWDSLGSDVPPELVRFAWFMPALVFIENWNADTKTGTLVAYNYELDARSTIAEGVSSFDLTSYPWDGLLYAVPRGKQQGLWFSKAK